ncbi:MAG: hypothetical protein EON57_13575 [Alphaproteobacteria bacterium]|nr:MAG: hypothetical protein EON57_13575 [Alphaproteobacteria bacterium]
MELLNDPNVWAAFATLTVMEIVLGIDNIVFISVLVSRLPAEQANRARRLGLALALIFRIALLLVISWIIGLNQVLFELFGHGYSWKDIILVAGGLLEAGLVRFLDFGVHLVRRLVDEEKAAGDEDDVLPRVAMAEQLEQHLVEADDPADHQ